MKLWIVLVVFLSFLPMGCEVDPAPDMPPREDVEVTQGEPYTSPGKVARYIHLYGELPENYITKDEAEEKGWVPEEGNLWEVTDEKSIGGDPFMNREGILPDETGRVYYTADVNYDGGYRGPERLVYSNDGLIFYTDDHYDTFVQVYPKEEDDE